MNMKLMAGLAVAITLASAMSFVGLASRSEKGSAVQGVSASVPKADSMAAESPSGPAGDGAVGVKLDVSDEPNVSMKLDVK